MKLLILSFYFPPDLSAGSFRTSALIDALAAQGRHHLTMEIMTTMPNRYRGMDQNVPTLEQCGSITIRRFQLPSHNSGMRDQSLSFLSYARQVLKEVRNKEFDLVFATSSRLMTASLGAYISRRMKVPLYLDIRDLFTDAMKDVVPSPIARPLLPILRTIERRTFKKASKINVVSQGFVDHIGAVVSSQSIKVFSNGIDPSFLTYDYSKHINHSSKTSKILYAGNIGEGQGLHNILPSVAVMLKGRAIFRIIGDGGRRKILEEQLHEIAKENVQLMPSVAREELHSQYKDADMLFLHLNNYDAFLKVLPSKIFEYAATGKPILAGVSGYAADFLRNEVPGVEVFKPCDAGGMIAAFSKLEASPKMFDRREFIKKYARSTIMKDMAIDILDTFPSKK